MPNPVLEGAGLQSVGGALGASYQHILRGFRTSGGHSADLNLQLIALCIVLFIRFRDKAKKGSIVPFVLGLIALAAATWAWHIGA